MEENDIIREAENYFCARVARVLMWTESLNSYGFEFLIEGLYALQDDYTREIESDINGRLDVLNAPADITADDVLAWWLS